MSDYQDHANAEITKLTKRLRSLLELPGMTKRTVAALTHVTPTIVGMAARGAPINTQDFLALAKWVDDQSTPITEGDK